MKSLIFSLLAVIFLLKWDAGSGDVHSPEIASEDNQTIDASSAKDDDDDSNTSRMQSR